MRIFIMSFEHLSASSILHFDASHDEYCHDMVDWLRRPMIMRYWAALICAMPRRFMSRIDTAKIGYHYLPFSGRANLR